METLIVQMGKVASTAIAEALRRRNRPVVQAHIASLERLQNKLTTMTGPGVSDAVAARMYEDYLQELRATFLLARQRLSGEQSKERLRVISLMRDPLNWYWSHFAQNYDHYQTLLRRYHEHHHGPEAEFQPEEAFVEVQRAMFQLLEQTAHPLDQADSLPALMREANHRDPTGVVFSQANRFLVPLRWFDEDFYPATGADIYTRSFNREEGYAEFEAPGLTILLLRYENLAQLGDRIAGFVGEDSLSLTRANLSEDKDIPFSIKKMQLKAQVMVPSALKDRIYGSRYARHFGYPLPRADWHPSQPLVHNASFD